VTVPDPPAQLALLRQIIGTATCAATTGPGPGGTLLASNCTFLRPGRIDQGDLLALAELAFDGRRLSCVNGEVSDATGTRLVTGEFLLSRKDACRGPLAGAAAVMGNPAQLPVRQAAAR
jgi:hypothetical protein